MPSIEISIGDLLNQLSSPDFFEREEAVKQLATINMDEAVAGLVMALEDEDRGIRELASEYLVSMGGDTASQLLSRYLGHEDISIRNLAAEILVRIGSDAVSALIAATSDAHHDVRKFAIDVLGLIMDVSAAEAIEKLLDDPNENVACSAAEALGNLKSHGSVAPLLEAFEKHDFLRPQAAEALGKIGDNAAVAELEKYLTTDDPVVLFSVIDALSHFKQDPVILKLVPFIDHDDQMISDAAIAAIIRIAGHTDRSVYQTLPVDRFKKYLLDSLESNDPLAVQFALRELRHWDGEDVLQELINFLKRTSGDITAQITEVIRTIGKAASELLVRSLADSTDEEKQKILDVIAKIGDPSIATALIPLAQSDNPDVRMSVATALGQCNSRDVFDTLKELTADAVGHVRSAAIKAIGWIGVERDVPLLIHGLDDPFQDVREASMGAMILIGGKSVINTFTNDLNHTSPERQRLAAMALGMIGEDETREPLKRAILHADPAVRRSAVESLSRIGDSEDIDTIKSVLSDEDSLVRKAAVSAMVVLIGAEAVDDIKALLTDYDMWVRYHTIDAIGSLREARFASLIIPHLKDDQDIVRIAAVKALAMLGDQSSIGHLRELATGDNEDLAAAVNEAIRSLMETTHG